MSHDYQPSSLADLIFFHSSDLDVVMRRSALSYANGHVNYVYKNSVYDQAYVNYKTNVVEQFRRNASLFQLFCRCCDGACSNATTRSC